MLGDLFKRTEHLIQQSVECKLKQMLKPFKRALNLNTKNSQEKKEKNYNTQTHTKRELKQRKREGNAFMESWTASVKDWDYWRAWLNIRGSKKL